MILCSNCMYIANDRKPAVIIYNGSSYCEFCFKSVKKSHDDRIIESLEYMKLLEKHSKEDVGILTKILMKLCIINTKTI